MLDLAYDEFCLLCRRSVSILRVLDVTKRLRFHDSNDRARTTARLPELLSADLDNAMWVVDAEGRAYRGFYAFRRITRGLPLLWPFVPILYVPGVSVVGVRVYARVARNRSRLGCRIDADDA